MERLSREFFLRDVLEVAPDLIGRELVLIGDSDEHHYTITEVEAYRGEDDKACHASKGKTARTAIMYGIGGHLYVYLIYGMYWMLNIVTGKENEPEAILIRGIEGYEGPGKLTQHLNIDGSYNGKDLCRSTKIWIAENRGKSEYMCLPRIGIEYAGEPWVSMPWRFIRI